MPRLLAWASVFSEQTYRQEEIPSPVWIARSNRTGGFSRYLIFFCGFAPCILKLCSTSFLFTKYSKPKLGKCVYYLWMITNVYHLNFWEQMCLIYFVFSVSDLQSLNKYLPSFPVAPTRGKRLLWTVTKPKARPSLSPEMTHLAHWVVMKMILLRCDIVINFLGQNYQVKQVEIKFGICISIYETVSAADIKMEIPVLVWSLSLSSISFHMGKTFWGSGRAI